ncbi:hypothetical protein BLOT_003833 [Blomia tropicalis]|nr:hypothetical protein BLOT_003833 [Blomia tropicalis]
MSYTPSCKLNLLLAAIITCGVLALVNQYLSPHWIGNVILDKVALGPNSSSYGDWQKSNIPIYTKFYLFNITNPDQMLKGKKPVLEEIGPYVFRHEFEKIDINWNQENDTVEYRQIKRWIFEPSMTERSLDDEIYHANVPLMSAVVQIQTSPLEEQYTAFESLNSLIEAFGMRAILRHRVSDLLFNGYHDSLLVSASNFYPTQVTQTKFGWFYDRNDTSSDGWYRIFTGMQDHTKLGLINTWEGDEELTKWKEGHKCRSFEMVSAGDLQPPFITRTNRHFLQYLDGNTREDPLPPLRMFIGDMCRVFELEPTIATNVMGMPTQRYRANPMQFNYSLVENQCYCQMAKCPPNGLYHVGVCAKGSPIYISFPHFLYADSSVQKSVIGMNPSVDKHEYFMDFDKNLAAPLKVDIRLQVNLLFKKVKEIEIMESWPDNLEIYLPQFWSSTSVTVNEQTKNQLELFNKVLNILPLTIFGLTLTLASVASLILCIVLYLLYTNQSLIGLKQMVKYESVSIITNKESRATITP